MFDHESGPTIDLQEIPFMIMANLLRARRQVSEAEKQQAKGIAVAKVVFDWPTSAWLGEAGRLRSQGRVDLAEYAFLVAEDLCESEDSLCKMLQNLGIAHRCKGELAAADAYYKRKIATALHGDGVNRNSWYIGNALVGRARNRYDVRDFESAERFLREALRDFDGPFMGLWARHELAGILEQSGKPEEAREYYAQVSASLQERVEKKAPSPWGALWTIWCLRMRCFVLVSRWKSAIFRVGSTR